MSYRKEVLIHCPACKTMHRVLGERNAFGWDFICQSSFPNTPFHFSFDTAMEDLGANNATLKSIYNATILLERTIPKAIREELGLSKE